MKPSRSERWVLAVALSIALVGAAWIGLRWYRDEVTCRRRGAALDARIERIRAVVRQIVPGTNKDAIIGLLEANGLRASFFTDPYLPTIQGTATADGCSETFGCGDEVFITVQVRTDSRGAAVERPKVEAHLDNCM